ncbi:hypothetical protein ACLD0U_04285 [Microbacterium sp. 2216-1]|uniref:hypothetical protein n=1 Tax=Microbacterium sp. 2216-1 TaxID=3390053 RepID=UPI0039755B98
MSKTTEAVVITVLETGFTVPHDRYSNRVAFRGEVITLTPEQVDDTRDRDGQTWLDLDDDAQRTRWGGVKFALGDRSEGIVVGEDDTHGRRYRQWQRARKLAEATSDPAERAAALKQVKKDFPEHVAQTQWTLSGN